MAKLPESVEYTDKDALSGSSSERRRILLSAFTRYPPARAPCGAERVVRFVFREPELELVTPGRLRGEPPRLGPLRHAA